MGAILDLLAKLLLEYGTELLSVGIAALVALIKRWLDKKGIKKELSERGVSEETINQVFKIKVKVKK